MVSHKQWDIAPYNTQMQTPPIVDRPIHADRLSALPEYLFVEIDRKKEAKIESGADVIDLGVGDPDRPTPDLIVNAFCEVAQDSITHRYPSNRGLSVFRIAAVDFIKRRFGVHVDPGKHVTACIGSKEGIAHLPLGVVNPNDIVLCGSIAYPVYHSGAIFAGASIYELKMNADNGWLLDYSDVPTDVANDARLLWINYPNNPTGAVAPLAFLEESVRFCRDHDIILASDAAYSEVYYDYPQPSLWQVEGVSPDSFTGIEFHSLSKTYNMTGWRIAFAVGHPEVIDALSAVKGNCDSGQFDAIQHAAIVAMNHYDHPVIRSTMDVYRQRRDAMCAGLQTIGCEVHRPEATFFVWAKCPEGWDSFRFCNRCLDEADVVFVPGGGFSKSANGYFRAALTVEVDRITESIRRIKQLKW